MKDSGWHIRRARYASIAGGHIALLTAACAWIAFSPLPLFEAHPAPRPRLPRAEAGVFFFDPHFIIVERRGGLDVSVRLAIRSAASQNATRPPASER
jgi:hypothetical protein